MTFPLDDIYLGPASFGPRMGTEGIIWHTTEAAGTSRAHAVGTAEWQKSNPGSYNFIIYDGGILTTVAPNLASGGVNPASSSWAPWRYPFLLQSLSVRAFTDPNAYLLNVAFSGKTAVFRDQGLPPSMLQTAKDLIAWAEATYPALVLHCGHMHWQTNRSDPSQQVLDAITSEDDVIVKTPIRRAEWWTKIGPASTFTRSDGTQGHFTARERVTSIADLTLDDGTRGLLLCYGEKHEALVMSRAGADGPPITESLGCGSGSDATCQAELASAKQTIEAQTDIIAEQKSKIAAAKLALE